MLSSQQTSVYIVNKRIPVRTSDRNLVALDVDICAVDVVDVVYIDNVRLAYSEEHRFRQLVEDSLYVHCGHILSVSCVKNDIILQAFDEEQIVEVNLYILSFRLDEDELVFKCVENAR